MPAPAVRHLIALRECVNHLTRLYATQQPTELPSDCSRAAVTQWFEQRVWISWISASDSFRARTTRRHLPGRHLTAITPVRFENLASVAHLMVIMLLITHWAACLWYYLYIQIPGGCLHLAWGWHPPVGRVNYCSLR